MHRYLWCAFMPDGLLSHASSGACAFTLLLHRSSSHPLRPSQQGPVMNRSCPCPYETDIARSVSSGSGVEILLSAERLQ
jgi:hypothetical protein